MIRALYIKSLQCGFSKCGNSKLWKVESGLVNTVDGGFRSVECWAICNWVR